MPWLGIDLGFRFISVTEMLIMCPDSLYLTVYKGEGRGIGFIHSVFQSRSNGWMIEFEALGVFLVFKSNKQ
jgi:hypothetical protein